MEVTSFVHPFHYLIVRREGTKWFFKSSGEVFYNPKNVPVPLALEDRLGHFGLEMSSVAVELFRVNGGKAGFYLVDLRRKQYYYCGTLIQGVQIRLLSLGIGRFDPRD